MGSRPYLLPLLAALGFLGGRFIPMQDPGRKQHAAVSRAAAAHPGTQDPSADRFIPTSGGFRPPPLSVSTETIESLLRNNNNDLYAPLALWLLDASAAQIDQFWAAYLKRGNPKDGIRDLVFTQWARCDPKGLIVAARRAGQEGPAWWAWGMADPDAALAASEGQPQAIKDEIIKGIASADPRRGIEMLEENPELARAVNVWALAEFAGREDGRRGVEFLLSLGGRYALDGPFKDWVGKDPHGAFRWLRERPEDPWLLKLFLERVKMDDPAALKEIAAASPDGEMKRSLKRELFTQIAASDPAKAVEMARGMESPRLVAECLALLGAEQLKAKQPEQALGMLAELLAKYPGAGNSSSPLVLPKGSAGSGRSVAGVQELVIRLAEWNPQAAMQTVVDAGANSSAVSIALKWSAEQPDDFTVWCEEHQDAAIKQIGPVLISNSLRTRKDYAGAAEWAMRIDSSEGRQQELGSLLQEWARQDPAAARQWLAQPTLGADLRSQLKSAVPGLVSP